MKKIKDFLIQKLTSKDKFIFDYNSDYDVIIVNQMMKQATKKFDNVKQFYNYIKSGTGFWMDVIQKFKKDLGLKPKEVPWDYINNYLTKRQSIMGNKQCGSKKRNKSFDFQPFYNKFRRGGK